MATPLNAALTEILVVAIGTRGDVLPFVALGEALNALGHEITLLSNADHETLARQRGLAFRAIARPNPAQTDASVRRAYADVVLPSFAQAYDAIIAHHAGGRRFGVVAHDLALGALFACEMAAAPNFRVVLAPCGLESTRFASPPNAEASVELDMLNTFRLARNLAPVASRSDIERLPAWLTLAMFSDRFAPPAWSDDKVLFTGFPFVHEATAPLDPQLQALLDTEPAPIVFTPGTGVAHISGLMATAAEVAERQSAPVLFLSAHAPVAPERPGRLLVRAYVPLAQLLPRARLIVHHGGVGTTAEALRAGTAQIIRPVRFDQPDNARRVVELGLGAMIAPEDFNADAVMRAIEGLQADPSLPSRLAAMSGHLQGSDALRLAAMTISDRMSNRDVTRRRADGAHPA